jgi:antitoxin Phd
MTHKTAAEVGAKLSENLKSVETTGEPVAIESDGRTVAVLVSAEDFALLQRLREEDEDRRDVEAVREARKEAGSVPWEKIKADLGL